MSENRLKVERIASVEGFRELMEEWNRLLSESGSDTLMLRWEWLFTWWDVFNDDTTELLILTVRDERRHLVGLAPLYLRRTRLRKFLTPIRQILFLGTGEEEESEICSEYLDVISAPGMEKAVLDSVLSYIFNCESVCWDEIVLKKVLENAKGLAAMPQLAEQYNIRCESSFEAFCYYVTLPDNWEEVLSGVKGKQRYEIRRDTKKISELGNAELVLYERKSSYMDWLKIILGLHQERWTSAGKPGVFSNDKFLQFHRKILAVAYQNKWLQLPVLFLDGEPVGALYNFVYGGKILEYQTGVKRTIGNGISVGNVLHSMVMQDAIARDLREYDFLSGNYDYKRRWATDARKLGEIKIYSSSLKVDVLRRLSTLKGRLR